MRRILRNITGVQVTGYGPLSKREITAEGPDVLVMKVLGHTVRDGHACNWVPTTLHIFQIVEKVNDHEWVVEDLISITPKGEAVRPTHAVWPAE